MFLSKLEYHLCMHGDHGIPSSGAKFKNWFLSVSTHLKPTLKMVLV